MMTCLETEAELSNSEMNCVTTQGRTWDFLPAGANSAHLHRGLPSTDFGPNYIPTRNNPAKLNTMVEKKKPLDTLTPSPSRYIWPCCYIDFCQLSVSSYLQKCKHVNQNT